MKLLRLSIYSALFNQGRTTLIPAKKICKDCRHFIGDKLDCRKYGDTNLITGKVTYESARYVREDEKKCGKDAIQFEENHFKIITVPYYFLHLFSFKTLILLDKN
jgi:hypothetical protein